MSTIAEILEQAVGQHRAGRLDAAAQLYQQVLATEPEHPDAMHLLGVVALQAGRADVAVEYISAAIRRRGGQAAFHANLAEALRALGRWPEAETACRQALQLEPCLVAAHNTLGLVAKAQGDLPAAIHSFQQALALDPSHADAHNNLGLSLQSQGQLAAALDCFRAAVASQPGFVRGHYNLGVAQATAGQPEEAAGTLERAITLDPRFAEAHYGLGIVRQRLGQLEAAEAAYRQALQLRPRWAEAASSLGTLYQAQGQFDEARRCYLEALQFDSQYGEAHYNLGTVLKEQGDLSGAIERYRQAIALRPNFAEAHYNLGTLLQKGGHWEDAAAAYFEALRHRPAYTLALNNLGNVYRHQHRLDEAIACYERALAIDPQGVDAQLNLGSAWQQQGHVERSLEVYEQIEAARPDSAEVHNNLGTARLELDDLQAARAHYERSIAIDPQRAEAHYNLALLDLLQGRMSEGWAGFAWRRKCAHYPQRHFEQPLWNGQPFAGTLLVHAEQGLGDTLQFVRWLPRVRELAERVILEVQPPLVPLLAASGIEAIPAGEALPPLDAHAPLLDLPGLLELDLADLPGPMPYLVPEQQLVDKWRARLAELSGYKIGIAWQGNRQFIADHRRSIPLREFRPLAKIPGVQLISLQKGAGSEQLEALAGDVPVLDFTSELDQSGAFMDTAALLAGLDLVITSDTAIAHLAGGLGARVWVALATAADWRWLRDRDDSPWYPTMRLFRQDQRGDWAGVFERMAAELSREPSRRE